VLDLHHRLSRAALLFGAAALLGPSLPAFAQSGPVLHPAAPALQVAQFSSTVQELQRELNQLGYSAGPADGLIGARTREAIQAYQRDQGLLVDGQATPALLSHVRATAQSRTAAPAVPGPEPASQLVAEIQDGLRSLGYPVGWPSGRLTQETRAAIRAYEADHGLLTSGEPSAPLLQHIRQRVAAAAPVPSVPDASTVAGIQAELRLRGYAIPQISGLMDSETRQAIRDYQQGQGTPVTGDASTALLEELRAASAEPATPPADMLLTREERAAAQRVLNARGYDAGPPDGVLGPRSRVAIRTFQADSNLTPSGELTPRTLELLGLAAIATPEPPPIDVPPYRIRIQDDFADGDYTRNPTWRIAAGRFEVRNGGLNSVVTAPTQSVEDIGRQILGGFLRQQLGVALPGLENAAAAYLPTRFGREFRITAILSGSAETHSQFDLGPFRGDLLNHGYRLTYRASQSRPLQLVFVDENGSSIIASSGFRFDAGDPHALVWERDADGRMIVSRGDEVLIDVADRNPIAEFDGFSLINAGGDWTLHQLTIEERS
jgi:peptidoglycan hydrolase-like protein with peptidoglycan-binding domain